MSTMPVQIANSWYRSEDVEALTQAGLQLSRAQTDCHVVCGPSGMGKTVTVEAALAALHDAGFRIVRAPCFPNAPSSVYGVWQRVASELRKLLPASFSVGPLLNELDRGAFARNTADRQSYRRAIHHQLFDALAEVSRRSPLVVVIEGLHLADGRSVATFGRLADQLARTPAAVALWGTTRAPLAGLSKSVQAGHIVERHLEPLPESSMRTMLRALLGEPDELSEERRKVLEQLVESGNPGLALESGRLGAEVMAASMSAACERTLLAMPSPERNTLRAATVVASPFESRDVEDLLDVVDDAAPLEALVTAGHLLKAGSEYWVASEAMGEACYQQMPQEIRGALHAMMARGLRALPSPPLQHLAWHYERAGHGAEAARTWMAAARNAEHAHANDQALEMYVRASRVTLDRAQSAQAVADRMQLLVKVGRNEEAVSQLDKLIAIAERNGSTIEQAHLLAERAHVAYRSGRGPEILEFATRALAMGRASGDRAATAHALRFVGVAHEFAGRFSEAEEAYLEIVQLSDDDATQRYLAGVCNSLGEIARASGRFDEAMLWYDRFDEEWRQRNIGVNVVYYSNKGAALAQAGDDEQADVLLTKAIDEMERTGHRAMVSEAYYYRGLSHLNRGELLNAASDAGNGYLVAEELGETEMQGKLARLLGLVRMAEADAGEAEMAEAAAEMLQQSVELSVAAGKPAEEAKSRIALARVLVASGNIGEAAMALQLAVALTADRELPIEHAQATRMLESLESGGSVRQ